MKLHNKQDKNFTTVNNEYLDDVTLSLKAQGLLTRLLKLPGDWDFHPKVFAKQVKDGVTAIYSAIQELEEAGYLVRLWKKNTISQFIELEYIYSDRKADLEPYLGNLNTGNFNTTKDLYNKDYINDEEDSGKQRSGISSSSLTVSNSDVSYGYDIDDWFRVAEENNLKPIRHGKGFKCLCPVHNEDTPSFFVNPGKKVGVVCYCQGCKAGIEEATQYLFPLSKNQKEDYSHFIYTDKDAKPLYKIVRSKDKTKFWVETPNNGKWARSELGGMERVPYRLHRLYGAVRGQETIYIVEGEKDVETAERHGLIATCNPFGANSWKSYFSQYFEGRDIIIIRDKDESGKKWASDVMFNLMGIVSTIQIKETPLNKEGADLTDHFEAGYRLGGFLNIISENKKLLEES